MQAQVVVFTSPKHLELRSLDLRTPGTGELEVDIEFSGISTGTERLLWDGTMPAFPGMGYPLVPGYESVGRITKAGSDTTLKVGSRVFVPGAQSFEGVRNLFGGSASRLVVPEERTVAVEDHLGAKAVLLALAATSQHALANQTPPDLIIGHGVMGRLLARLTMAAGHPAPTVWELNPDRQHGATGYSVMHPDQDARRDYRAIYDVSGDSTILDKAISRQAPGGEVVLAGFYKESLSFAFAPAFMRETRIRIATQWKPDDLLVASALAHSGKLSLDGLITHTEKTANAANAYEVAFTDAGCLKMILDWKHSA
ncbi:MAG: chlorophyll synthesis pathway protein BchC [Vitreoscilla sp.]|nr:chlorophyll synthesis pathway protein BchC [Polaromonas sp.]